jgi:DNA-binding HxlR family transcriptional regulator
MKRTDNKSHCPVNFTLEVVGDPWSLVVLRDIVYFGKHSFKEFMSSDEKITTSVLADRLSKLEKNKIIVKKSHPTDERIGLYTLTEKGLDLVPILLCMMEWGTKYDPKSTGHRKADFVARIREEQGLLTKEVKNIVRGDKGVFVS